ncbi:MAG: hypothetical protein LBR38_09475 [Synergistaceae bacterium]|nr:hypothetical protein [Synergistaceae bacterium]
MEVLKQFGVPVIQFVATVGAMWAIFSPKINAIDRKVDSLSSDLALVKSDLGGQIALVRSDLDQVNRTLFGLSGTPR